MDQETAFLALTRCHRNRQTFSMSSPKSSHMPKSARNHTGRSEDPSGLLEAGGPSRKQTEETNKIFDIPPTTELHHMSNLQNVGCRFRSRDKSVLSTHTCYTKTQA
jgi:hypothetical protein